MAEQSFDITRTTRDQQRRIATATAIGFNALKPVLLSKSRYSGSGPIISRCSRAIAKRNSKHSTRKLNSRDSSARLNKL
jgi:hypothetical protein